MRISIIHNPDYSKVVNDLANSGLSYERLTQEEKAYVANFYCKEKEELSLDLSADLLEKILKIDNLSNLSNLDMAWQIIEGLKELILDYCETDIGEAIDDEIEYFENRIVDDSDEPDMADLGFNCSTDIKSVLYSLTKSHAKAQESYYNQHEEKYA
jgi:hypothetical protein